MEDQSFNKFTSVEEEDVEQISQPFKQTKSNIPPATITKNTTLVTIFLFNIDNLNTHSLFSGAAINQDKPITALYTDAKVGGIDIKLILDSRLAADRNTKTLIGEIDNFSFEINGIQIPTKVLVMEATQYQALVGNDWLSKANTTFDWNTQELQLTFNGQHAQVPVTCRYFKTQYIEESLIEFEDTLLPPTIKTYQKKKEKAELKKSPNHLVYWKDLNDQNDKASGTTCRVLHNDVPGRGGTCNKTCQYTILINDWVQKGTLIKNAWK
ncbi:hypothetical protein G9A89_014511 [Geosiphon pyriformis]|nr:hypothetical protein G9A89_014511 [Geosiphon pyriformis]